MNRLPIVFHISILISYLSFPLAFALVVVGFFLTMRSLGQVQYDVRCLFYATLWASMSIAITAFVRANGRVFCNRPRLHKPWS